MTPGKLVLEHTAINIGLIIALLFSVGLIIALLFSIGPAWPTYASPVPTIYFWSLSAFAFTLAIIFRTQRRK